MSRTFPGALLCGGSPRIYAGEERFSAPEKSRLLSMRFSAGHLRRRSRRDAHHPMLPFISDPAIESPCSLDFAVGSIDPASRYYPFSTIDP